MFPTISGQASLSTSGVACPPCSVAGFDPLSVRYEKGLINTPFENANFAFNFYRATTRSGNIKFNLEGVNIEKALAMDKKLVRSIDPIRNPDIKGKGLITEWELRQVLHNKELFDKTIFQWGSNIEFTADEAASMGLKYLGESK